MNPVITTAAALLLSAPAFAGERVAYSVDGAAFSGFLAEPAESKGTVVVLPTWLGLSDYEMDRATMLAELGFTAFAADLYPDGQRPTTMEEREASLKAIVSNRERMQALLRAAVDEARRHGGDPLVVMGYSMGAGVTMELAWSGLGQDLGVDGYGIFSGRVSDSFGRMMPDGPAPFFVAYGEADNRVQADGLITFASDVELAGGDAEIRTYPGAGHLFSAFGFPNYDAEADADSWAAYTAFLNRIAD